MGVRLSFRLSQHLIDHDLVAAGRGVRVVRLVGPEEPRAHSLALGQLHRAGLKQGKGVLMLQTGTRRVVQRQPG